MIPYRRIDTIFLDVGNTLISIDFDWIAAELSARGFMCAGDALCRAEAAARPAYSRQLLAGGLEADTDPFHRYLMAMLARLEVTARLGHADLEALAGELRLVLRPDGRASGLWRSVMPRIPEALARLRNLGLRLVVVSNSDGTVEHSLQTAGLRPFLTAVIDSALVGFEKPDPRIFLRAIELCGAHPERTLHVGDLYHTDVEGARRAGLHVVLIDPFDDWAGADCVRLPDLWALADVLEEAKRKEFPSRERN